MDEQTILFQGELQLTAWGESSTTGAWVKFWVHPEDLESFKLLRVRAGKQVGQRLACVLVEIGDAEEAVAQTPPPSPRPTPAPRRYEAPQLGECAMIAVRWCRDPAFQRWAARVTQSRDGDQLGEAACKSFILRTCGLIAKHGDGASRKHLDVDHEACDLFHKKIRIPYRDYLRELEQ